MAGLACRRPSSASLKILLRLASDFVTVSDSTAIDVMRALARGEHGDVPSVFAESSAARMGISRRTESDLALRKKLGLNIGSQVLFLGLDGATYPAIYRELTGLEVEEVFRVQNCSRVMIRIAGRIK